MVPRETLLPHREQGKLLEVKHFSRSSPLQVKGSRLEGRLQRPATLDSDGPFQTTVKVAEYYPRGPEG